LRVANRVQLKLVRTNTPHDCAICNEVVPVKTHAIYSEIVHTDNGRFKYTEERDWVHLSCFEMREAGIG
jgi:hypothetical protein